MQRSRLGPSCYRSTHSCCVRKVRIFDVLSQTGFWKSNLLSFVSFQMNPTVFIHYGELSSISTRGRTLRRRVRFGASQVRVLNHQGVAELRNILDHDNPLLRHIALYAAANMFLLDHLKELAVAQFSSDCNHHLGSEAASVAHFYDAVYHVFRDTSSSDSLLAATVTVITRNRTRFTKDPKFRDLLRDIPDLLSLIVQQWASEASKL